MAMEAALVILLLAVPTVYGAQFTVGDSAGWDSGVNYDNWVSGKTFSVGDTLVFNYGSTHKVDEVNENDYKSCSSSNVIKSHSGGPTTISLTKPGSVYFICPTAGHCPNGMKLQINVLASGTPTTPAAPSPSNSTTPSTTPSTPNATVTPPPPPSPSGATSRVGNLMLGFLLVLATMVSFMS